MAARPTDRTPTSKIEKLSAKISQTISTSTALKPVNQSLNYLARKAIFRALKHLQFGSLTLIENFGQAAPSQQTFGQIFGEPVKDSAIGKKEQQPAQLTSSKVGRHSLHVTLTLHDSRVYRRLLLGGSIALADSYIEGQWDTDDLTGLIRLAARNLAVLNKLENRFAGISKAFEKANHQLRSNDAVGSKSNILAHYDLGNEMYQRFLDESMMYSSAVYPAADSSLSEAQQHKLELICQRLQLSADDKIIEIGTGWGGFAIYAAPHYGCHVTTTTISDAQFKEAERRVKAAGLSNKITLLKQDYRKLTGQYDKLVSIEMIEAVGHEYLPTFFAKCNSLLKPTGLMVLQAITFNDQNYKSYLESVDFIQTHIFPGGCLLSNQELTIQFTEQTDMVIKQLHDYGFDYAYTLRDWRAAFMAQHEQIKALGYDEAFIRLWEFYFCYCEGGFLERTIGVVQVTAVKPDNIDTLHFSDLPAAHGVAKELYPSFPKCCDEQITIT
ncbi:SAM-dependent methyltransferase [Psychrobacter jeotgali]|uniref:SAM-dependent methyltransferase n=1 Tax=Psychrobacter jeotgali TaxID=179010 RepID=UPI001917F602|nr:cyclopropane-fatty-acyl-phospholipid synthase family protein [Psychrobacter jeotgali]